MERMTDSARRALMALALVPLAAVMAACGTPQTATNLVAIGLKAQLSGDLATAETSYQQAIKADANNDVAHYDLGTVYDKQGITARAVAEYRAALVIEPTFTDALFNLAVDTTTSDPASAHKLYLRVITLQPTFAAAWLNVGFILQSEGSVAEAKADWARAASLDASLASRIPTTPASEVGTGSTKPSPKPAP
jgi:tetratricopeptide (TPR) repeat protein